MHRSVAKMDVSGPPKSTGVSVARMLIMLALAFGYISTMARGPGTAEYGRIFGYDPSWHATNILFIFAGFFALKTLNRHGSALQMLKTRARRNLIPVAIFAVLVISVIFPLFGKPAASLGETLSRLGDYAFGLMTCTDPGALLPGLLDDALYMCSIQGAIWTLRWGAMAYLATALLWQIGVYRHKVWIYTFAGSALLAYMIGHQNYVVEWVVLKEQFYVMLAPLRLGAMFLVGTAAYSWASRKKVVALNTIILGAAACFAIAVLNFIVLPWTPIIEVSSAFGFTLMATALIKYVDQSKLKDMPIRDLTIWIFLIHWPAAQLLLLAFPNTGSWALITMTLPVTLILAFLLSKAVEVALFLHSSPRTIQA